jgi:hypothetical protein
MAGAYWGLWRSLPYLHFLMMPSAYHHIYSRPILICGRGPNTSQMAIHGAIEQWNALTLLTTCPIHVTLPGSARLSFTDKRAVVTRYYDFTVSRGTLSPDGVAQSMIIVNGQFTGPTIYANWGDMCVTQLLLQHVYLPVTDSCTVSRSTSTMKYTAQRKAHLSTGTGLIKSAPRGKSRPSLLTGITKIVAIARKSRQ